MMFFSGLFSRLGRSLSVAALMTLMGAVAGPVWADPPGRVGRVSDVTGQVWFYSPDAGEWISAQRNRPLTSGDRLSTDASARAELRIGSTTVRLDSGSELEVRQIDDRHIALQLHSGSVAARLRDNESVREFELTTPEGRFQTQRTGSYRVDRRDEQSELTVISGQALYEGNGSALTVYSGQRAEFWLAPDNTAQYSLTEPVRDEFDAWNRQRDRSDERSASTRYVSPEMTGVEDLDQYGRWEQAPEYGAVWYPRSVPVGWAPYAMGHWAWVSPWGWTWIDDAPWGFAPFHYGRWAMVHQRWGWVPGTYVQRPVYAPALVAWVGGPQLSVSISVGGRASPSVGWFPLAPREVYVPTYRVSPTYVKQVNITHVTRITNVTTIVNNPQTAVSRIDYRNRRFPHAVTVVPQSVMVNRQPTAPAAAELREARGERRFAHSPTRQVALSAPPVNPPSDVVRRIHERQQRAADTRPGLAPPSAPAVPASPSRADRPPRADVGAPGHRGRDRRDAVRPVPAEPNAVIRAAQPPTATPSPQADPAAEERRGRPRDMQAPRGRGRSQDEAMRAPPAVPSGQPQVAAPVVTPVPQRDAGADERRSRPREVRPRGERERQAPEMPAQGISTEPGQAAPRDAVQRGRSPEHPRRNAEERKEQKEQREERRGGRQNAN